MKLTTVALAGAFAMTGALALAQGNPSGPGAVKGDPAASSANPHAGAPNVTGANTSNPSGSGTSPSGGKDDNPDHGFGVAKDRKNTSGKK
jgi:hypothetical protein